MDRGDLTLPRHVIICAMPALPVIAPDQVQRLLIVKLSSLGDVVHTLPLLDALRVGYGPDTKIAWVVRDKFAPLLAGNPNLSGLHQLRGSGISALWATRSALQAGKFDVALDAQGLLKSGVVARLSGAPVRVGFDLNREGSGHFLTHPVVPARHRAHMVDKLMGFCDALGLPRLPVRPQTYLANGNVGVACVLMGGAGDSGPVVGCIVGASTPEKAWPVERWAQAARLLADAGTRPVLLGGPGEVETARQIVESAGGAVARNLAGETTPQVLASVLARCQVVIGGDSGPTHLAVAVGTPVVGLYGVTDPVRTGPNWGASPAVVLDFAEKDAPPKSRRPRHAGLTDAIARIPADVCARAALALLTVQP